MIDLNKSLEYFNPKVVKGRVNIVGCGAVGSHVATLLARLGIEKFKLWDEDTVSSHNIANQNFVFSDIGRPKTEVVAEQIKAINPDADVEIGGFVDDVIAGRLSNTVVVCVDSIKVRQMIAAALAISPWDYTICDFRMGLTSGQNYIVKPVDMPNYVNTMRFTDEEADAVTPKSACNFELSVCYSIWAMLGIGVARLVKSWKGEKVDMSAIIDCDNMGVITF